MIEYSLINYCENDKYAAKAYSLIHSEPESKNLGDITLVDEKEIADFNMMTWGFPCQDISIAGKQKGMIEGETRSGLYYDGLRILQEKKPALSIVENVKNLTGKKFKEVFKQILQDLNDAGYNNYRKVLNAKDYGIPQNRERVFIISIRKDLDNGKFQFPVGFDNGIRLKDLLEDEVDEKYYISQDKVDKLIEKLKDKKGICTGVYNQKDGFKEKEFGCTLDASYYKGLGNNQDRNAVLKVGNTNPSGNGMNGSVYSEEGLSPTLTTNKGEGLKILQVGMLDIKGNEQVRRVYDPDGLSPTLNSMQGGNRQPKILEENELIQVGTLEGKGFESKRRVYNDEGICPTLHDVGSTTPKIIQGCSTRTRSYMGQPEQLEVRDDELSNSITTVQKDSMTLEISKSPAPELIGGIGEINFGKQYRQGNRVYSSEKTAMCLLSQPVGNAGGNSYLYEINYRIRKLTPLECIRLMGFEDEVYYILKENGISNSQIYKMAGNSIVVDVLYYIMLEIYKVMPYLLEDIRLSSFFSGIGAFEKSILRLQKEVASNDKVC